ncbi:hypothetical protein ACFU3E_04605 [Streptomyces sp. NPDC057424]|uniref:hypothetical protein n=1 Tax=Streptomyces sp. NPDC057424 TaxID=3346127 RepID=UPI0036802B78
MGARRAPGAPRPYLADPDAVRPAGVMIGSPGLDEVVGGRGPWRAGIAVHGTSGHSGSRRTAVGAVSRAAHLVRLLDTGPPAARGERGVPAAAGGHGDLLPRR